LFNEAREDDSQEISCTLLIEGIYCINHPLLPFNKLLYALN